MSDAVRDEDVMILGCTYAIDIESDDHTLDLTAFPYLYVTLEQGTMQKTFSGDRLDIWPSKYELTVTLTQEESLSFKPGAVQVQLNWLVSDGKGGFYRDGTDQAPIIFEKQLLRRMLPINTGEVTR